MPNKALLAMIVALGLCAAAGTLWANPPTSGPQIGPGTDTVGAPKQTSPGGPTPPPGGTDGGEKRGDGGGGGFFGGGSQTLLLVMVGVIVLMLVMSSRGRRKQEAKRQQLLSSMKKGDRVTTAGGIIGTLVEVREHEVVVKIDEQNNTRVRLLKSYIAHVGDTPGEKEPQKN